MMQHLLRVLVKAAVLIAAWYHGKDSTAFPPALHAV